MKIGLEVRISRLMRAIDLMIEICRKRTELVQNCKLLDVLIREMDDEKVGEVE